MLVFALFFLVVGAAHAVPLFTLARLAVGGMLLVAGIMLWRGHRSMYSVSLFAWAVAAIYGAARVALAPGLAQEAVYLLVAIPVSVYLYRESRAGHAA
jgi:hypothetical protein